MTGSLQHLLAELRLSLVSPRDGARRIIALNPPMSARWTALALIAIAGTFLMLLSRHLFPEETLPPALAALMTAPPLASALVNAISLLLVAGLIYTMGRAVGGQGRLDDSLTVLIWFQFIMLCLQSALLVVQLLLPSLIDIPYLAVIVLFFWLLTGFVAELHGFKSLPITFFGILAALAALTLLLGVVLALLLGSVGGIAPS